MSEYYGKEYNYDIFKPSNGAFEDFRSIFHAEDRPPDFTLPLLDGGEITLSKLRRKPVVIEFGSIT